MTQWGVIGLDDPIWSRLYGPYGVQDVAGQLRTLQATWDEALARDLFWERLHHQETLYPVTYAALPWLLTIAQAHPQARAQVLGFASWVIYCAVSDHPEGCCGTAAGGRYDGLSLDIETHQHDWLPQAQRLVLQDKPMLERLEKQTRRIFDTLESELLAAMDTALPSEAGYLLVGVAAKRGALGLVSTLQCLPDQELHVFCPGCGADHWLVFQDGILQPVEPAPNAPLRPLDLDAEQRTARFLAGRLHDCHPQWAKILTALADWRCGCQSAPVSYHPDSAIGDLFGE